MVRCYIPFLLLAFSFKLSFGQKIGDYYVSISIDSTSGGRLKFLSESTVELSSIPLHMSSSLRSVYKYIATDSTIEILPELFNNQDSQSLSPYRQYSVLKTRVSLTRIDGDFIDYIKSLIYVRASDFDKKTDLTWVVNRKTYIQDMGETNGYGIVRKSPKTNRALQKKLKGIDEDNCTIEIVRGLNAYKRFGIKRVFGVIVITTK